jgi:hypothetical protein
MEPSKQSRLRRAKRRVQDGGAVVFIVAMTLSVLAAMGLYALQAASTEIRTAGYERQSAQSYYLSEYGILGLAQELTGPKVGTYVGMMTSPTPNQSETVCLSLPYLPSTASLQAKACRRWSSTELKTVSKWPVAALDPFNATSNPLAESAGWDPGSLGTAPMFGDFIIEITDPSPALTPPGTDFNLGLCFYQFTVTSIGLTQPVLTGATDDAAKYAATGLVTTRARIVAGPTQCQKK